MDVSADLTELGKTPMAVVSAGVKSILDIGKTLEYLVCKISLKRSGEKRVVVSVLLQRLHSG